MTLGAKVAQLQVIGTKDPHRFDADDHPVKPADAALLAHGASMVQVGPFDAAAAAAMFSVDPALQVRKANAGQKYLRTRTRLGIPVLTGAEARHGYMMGHATSFPGPVTLGSTWDPALVELDLALHRRVQPGDFEVRVGRSSADALRPS